MGDLAGGQSGGTAPDQVINGGEEVAVFGKANPFIVRGWALIHSKARAAFTFEEANAISPSGFSPTAFLVVSLIVKSRTLASVAGVVFGGQRTCSALVQPGGFFSFAGPDGQCGRS